MSRVQLHTRRFMLAFVCLFFSASLVGCMITRVKLDFLLHEGNHIGVVQQLVKDRYNYSEYKNTKFRSYPFQNIKIFQNPSFFPSLYVTSSLFCPFGHQSVHNPSRLPFTVFPKVTLISPNIL